MPVLITGLLMGYLGGSLQWVKSHLQQLVIVSLVLMAILGILLIFNQLLWVTTKLQEIMRAVGLEWLVNLG